MKGASVRIVALALALYNIGAIISTLQNPYAFGLWWMFQVAINLVFAGAFTWVFLSRRYIVTLFAVFVIYSGLRLVLLIEADYDRQRLPFVLLVFIGFVFVSVLWGRNDNKEENE
ncbi:MAG: hypothetical protein OHK0046_26900 [Anaerolineae bacterium]